MVLPASGDHTGKHVVSPAKPVFWIPLLLLFLLAAGGVSTCYLPYDLQAREKRIVIHEGEMPAEIARSLQEERLLRFPRLFVFLSRFSGQDRGIRAGEFRLHSSMSPRDILENLNSARVRLRSVTVAEGLTLNQIARLLESEGLADAHAVLEAAADPRFVRELGVEGGTLEGYLYPDTYTFPPGQSPRQILKSLVRQFWRVYGPQMRRDQIRMGWRVHDVVTLASIIEKETALSEEKPLISSTLRNRLLRDMPLQCDPTVIYGVDDFDGNLTKAHLLQRNPYNTYLNKGLPPGPICNPGLDSLLAVLQPAQASYLYFVSKNDGTHHFSSTLKEHNRAVGKFQTGGSKPRKAEERAGKRRR